MLTLCASCCVVGVLWRFHCSESSSVLSQPTRSDQGNDVAHVTITQTWLLLYIYNLQIKCFMTKYKMVSWEVVYHTLVSLFLTCHNRRRGGQNRWTFNMSHRDTLWASIKTGQKWFLTGQFWPAEWMLSLSTPRLSLCKMNELWVTAGMGAGVVSRSWATGCIAIYSISTDTAIGVDAFGF